MIAVLLMPLHAHKNPQCTTNTLFCAFGVTTGICRPVLTMWGPGIMKALYSWKADIMCHFGQVLLWFWIMVISHWRNNQTSTRQTANSLLMLRRPSCSAQRNFHERKEGYLIKQHCSFSYKDNWYDKEQLQGCCLGNVVLILYSYKHEVTNRSNLTVSMGFSREL